MLKRSLTTSNIFALGSNLGTRFFFLSVFEDRGEGGTAEALVSTDPATPGFNLGVSKIFPHDAEFHQFCCLRRIGRPDKVDRPHVVLDQGSLVLQKSFPVINHPIAPLT